MSEESVERRLTTILAADVVGYSRLMASDEERTLAALRHLREEIIATNALIFGGQVVKSLGDGVLMQFDLSLIHI